MEQLSVRKASERIDALLDELEQSAVPAVMQRVQELVQCVMALHAEGLRRVLGASSEDLVRELAEDEVVGNLLVLHGLHPDDVDTRVQRALAQVRPLLGTHADEVTLSRVDESGRVHLQVSSGGCAASTVQTAVEDAILTIAPDVVAVVTEVVESAPLLQIAPFRPHERTPA